MLPNGEVIPYAHFFTPSLSVKDIMKEVIEKEGKPLTDAEIVERLQRAAASTSPGGRSPSTGCSSRSCRARCASPAPDARGLGCARLAVRQFAR